MVVAADQHSAELLLGVLPLHIQATVLMLSSEPEAATLGESILEEVRDAQVVILESTQRRRDLAGWLSARLTAPLVWGVSEIRSDEEEIEADQLVLGGSHKLIHHMRREAGPLVALAKPVTSIAPQSRQGITRFRQLGAPDIEPRVRVLEAAGPSNDGVPLAAAKTIISVGRGIGGPEHVPLYRELADRIGAALGASRVAVDSGWVPFAHQVGQTGTAVAPDLYVAFGISGAVQHLAGMRASKTVVAVNTDHEAPMCRVADLVIRADANEVVGGLLAKLESASRD